MIKVVAYMSKFLFFGDSITDAWRGRSPLPGETVAYGCGFVNRLAGELLSESVDNQVFNRGIAGDRIVDLYARIRQDFWNLEPDCVTILVGANDVWHEINSQNGVDIKRFENIYRLIISETKEKFPSIRIILMEPFVHNGASTIEHYGEFLEIYNYAKIVKKLAKEFDLELVELQEKFNELIAVNGSAYYLADGIHPTIVGAKVIADEWLKVYKRNKK